MTVSWLDFPLAAWSLLLSQRQDFLNNQLAWVPITPKQEGTSETRDEVFSSVGAQDMDTKAYRVSSVWSRWCWNLLGKRSAGCIGFKPGKETPSSPSTFNDFEMSSMSENPTLVDEEHDKENSPPPPHPKTLVFGRPTQPPVLMRSQLFQKKWNCSKLCLYKLVWKFYIVVTVFVFEYTLYLTCFVLSKTFWKISQTFVS